VRLVLTHDGPLESVGPVKQHTLGVLLDKSGRDLFGALEVRLGTEADLTSPELM
jgi:hypothetical protein